MPQFDVHRNTGRQKAVPFVVIVQSQRFDRAQRRIVVPMVHESAMVSHDRRLHPVFEIEGKNVVLNPLQIASVDVERLGEHVGSVKADGDRVIAAIDLVISRAWD